MQEMQEMHLRQLFFPCKFCIYFKLSDVPEMHENSPAQECMRFRNEFITLF